MIRKFLVSFGVVLTSNGELCLSKTERVELVGCNSKKEGDLALVILNYLEETYDEHSKYSIVLYNFWEIYET